MWYKRQIKTCNKTSNGNNKKLQISTEITNYKIEEKLQISNSTENYHRQEDRSINYLSPIIKLNANRSRNNYSTVQLR